MGRQAGDTEVGAGLYPKQGQTGQPTSCARIAGSMRALGIQWGAPDTDPSAPRSPHPGSWQGHKPERPGSKVSSVGNFPEHGAPDPGEREGWNGTVCCAPGGGLAGPLCGRGPLWAGPLCGRGSLPPPPHAARSRPPRLSLPKGPPTVERMLGEENQSYNQATPEE